MFHIFHVEINKFFCAFYEERLSAILKAMNKIQPVVTFVCNLSQCSYGGQHSSFQVRQIETIKEDHKDLN